VESEAGLDLGRDRFLALHANSRLGIAAIRDRRLRAARQNGDAVTRAAWLDFLKMRSD
jgi:hypothetical protein